VTLVPIILSTAAARPTLDWHGAGIGGAQGPGILPPRSSCSGGPRRAKTGSDAKSRLGARRSLSARRPDLASV